MWRRLHGVCGGEGASGSTQGFDLAAGLARGQSPFDGVEQGVIGKRLLQHRDSPGPLQPFGGAGIIQRGNQDYWKAGRRAGEMVLEVGAAHSRKTYICYEAIGVAGIVGEELFGGLEGKNGEAGRSQQPAERTPNFFVVVYYCDQGFARGRPVARSMASGITPDAHVCHWTLGSLLAPL